MTKFVLWLSFMGLTLLLVFGLVAPTSPVMWLATTTPAFAVLRGVLMFTILLLLVTEPPRNAYLRAFVGIISTTLIVWSLSAGYQNHLPIVDALILLSTGISSAITVLERPITIDLPAYFMPTRLPRLHEALGKLAHAHARH